MPHAHIRIQSKLRNITLGGNQSARDIKEFCSDKNMYIV